MRNFRTLTIGKSVIKYVQQIYLITTNFPEHKRFGFISQMQRAVVSIPSNIAEGCSKSSDTEYKRYLQIAIGSAFELEAHLIQCQNVNYITQTKLSRLLFDLHIEQKNKRTHHKN
jgi:four helix bundle protein